MKYNFDFETVLNIFDEFHQPSEEFIERFLLGGDDAHKGSASMQQPPSNQVSQRSAAAKKGHHEERVRRGRKPGGSSRRKSVTKAKSSFRASMYMPATKQVSPLLVPLVPLPF